jgi:hypothetical protein
MSVLSFFGQGKKNFNVGSGDIFFIWYTQGGDERNSHIIKKTERGCVTCILGALFRMRDKMRIVARPPLSCHKSIIYDISTNFRVK